MKRLMLFNFSCVCCGSNLISPFCIYEKTYINDISDAVFYYCDKCFKNIIGPEYVVRLFSGKSIIDECCICNKLIAENQRIIMYSCGTRENILEFHIDCFNCCAGVALPQFKSFSRNLP